MTRSLHVGIIVQIAVDSLGSRPSPLRVSPFFNESVNCAAVRGRLGGKLCENVEGRPGAQRMYDMCDVIHVRRQLIIRHLGFRLSSRDLSSQGPVFNVFRPRTITLASKREGEASY